MFPFDDVIMDQNRYDMTYVMTRKRFAQYWPFVKEPPVTSGFSSQGVDNAELLMFSFRFGKYDSSYYLYVLIAQIEIISRGNQGPTNIYIYILVLLHCPLLFSQLLPKSYTARVNLPMILIINTLLQLVQCMKVFVLGKQWGWRHIPSQLAWPHQWLVCSFENIYIKIV